MSELLRFPAPPADQRTLPCDCGHRANYRELRTKPVLTVVGKVEISRPYYLCSDCHIGQFPADVELDIEHTEFSPGVRRMQAVVGQDAPFRSWPAATETPRQSGGNHQSRGAYRGGDRGGYRCTRAGGDSASHATGPADRDRPPRPSATVEDDAQQDSTTLHGRYDVDFTKSIAVERFCRDALAQHARLFRLWHKIRGAKSIEPTDPALDPHQKQIVELAERHLDSQHCEVRNLATALFQYNERLFAFLEEAGVEPTNNSAERALRTNVQWRKTCFANRSAEASWPPLAC